MDNNDSGCSFLMLIIIISFFCIVGFYPIDEFKREVVVEVNYPNRTDTITYIVTSNEVFLTNAEGVNYIWAMTGSDGYVVIESISPIRILSKKIVN